MSACCPVDESSTRRRCAASSASSATACPPPARGARPPLPQLPCELWLAIYSGGLDGKFARRIAHLCGALAEAARKHEDNDGAAAAERARRAEATEEKRLRALHDDLFGSSDSDASEAE